MADKNDPVERFLDGVERTLRQEGDTVSQVANKFELLSNAGKIGDAIDSCKDQLAEKGTCNFSVDIGGDELSINLNGIEGYVKAERTSPDPNKLTRTACLHVLKLQR